MLHILKHILRMNVLQQKLCCDGEVRHYSKCVNRFITLSNSTKLLFSWQWVDKAVTFEPTDLIP